eukprot:TRINITY_DN479_c0_g1_i2.p1 TRINITY_DN479_c0_g1~~TRINITY_DN479_c0_g1_i2.p1  ORF type:complete len:232 (-),score=68.01 TRINITY_DN479_c0_g1_i2:62-757(-)
MLTRITQSSTLLARTKTSSRRNYRNNWNNRSYTRSTTQQQTNYFAYAGAVVAGALAVSSWWNNTEAEEVEQIPHYGVPGTNKERTFIAIKPDGVQRGIIGEIIKRFEAKGYKLVGLKMIWPTQEFAAEHYSDLSTKPFFGGLVKYFSSGPVVAMVWEGRNSILGGRKLVGATNPDDSAPGSIRGDLCINVGRNIIHGSDGPEAAQDEISLWFTPEEIQNYDLSTAQWVYEK